MTILQRSILNKKTIQNTTNNNNKYIHKISNTVGQTKSTKALTDLRLLRLFFFTFIAPVEDTREAAGTLQVKERSNREDETQADQQSS